MKKLIYVLAIFALTLSCTNSTVNEYEKEYTQSEGEDDIEKGNACPPNDRNCNGIPDNEE